MFDSHLRRNKLGNQPEWSKAELLAGLQYFFRQYGRFPTAHEIDAFDFLPSSRSIQRTHGGLVNLRNELLPGHITNYTQGEYRSQKAKETYAQGRDFERDFYSYLVTVFQPIAVHEHKVIRPGNVNCDFYIYQTLGHGIIIDIFYAKSLVNLINIVNIKLKRYTLVDEPTYLVVVGNDSISQVSIDHKTENRRIALPSHVVVCCDEYFRSVIVPKLASQSDYKL